MAGHSKWSQVQQIKGPLDQKRGQFYSKLSKDNGTLATPGTVAYMFHNKGRITVPAASIGEEKLLEPVIEAGGKELVADEETHVNTTAPDQLCAVPDALKAAGLAAESQKLTFVPENVVVSDETIAAQVMHLIEALEDSGDVPHAPTNFAPSDEVLERLSA